MTQGHRPRAGASVELDSLLADLRLDLRRLRGSLNRTTLVEWLRLRSRALDAVFRLAFYLCVLGFCLVASITAAVFLAVGIRDALAGWSQSEWIGNLGAGIGILALAIGAGLAIRARWRSEGVRQARGAIEGVPVGNGGPRSRRELDRLRGESWRDLAGDARLTGRRLGKVGAAYARVHPLPVLGGSALVGAALASRTRRKAPIPVERPRHFALRFLHALGRFWLVRSFSFASAWAEKPRSRRAEGSGPRNGRSRG